MATDKYKLLSTKPTFVNLKSLWGELKVQYEELNTNSQISEFLELRARISRLESEHLATLLAIKVLKFEFNEDMINILQVFHYKIDKDNYLDKIDEVEKDSKGLLVTIKQLIKKLPKANKNQNIDKIMIAYNDGKMMDTNKATVMQFLGQQQLFEEKVKAIEKQTSDNKNGR